MGIMIDYASGLYLESRFAKIRELAQEIRERVSATKAQSEPVQVYTPTVMRGGSWGFKLAVIWSGTDGRYMVGYDLDDPTHATQIYRRKHAHLPPGDAINPTYTVGITTVWQASELDRVEQSLLRIA